MREITVRAGIIFFAFVFAGQLYAQQTDVVVMKNGDKLTCEIKSLETGVLYVKLDYVDGTIAVQWSKVARIESSRSFRVKTELGRVFTGKISTIEVAGDQPVKIEVAETPGNKVEIDSDRIATMDTREKRIWRRFNGEMNLGLLYAKANQSTQYNFRTLVEYPAERWLATAQFDSNLSSSTFYSSERNQLSFGARHLLRKENYFYSGFATFLQSSVQDIKLQTALGGGIGHYFKNSSRTKIALIGGLAWQRTHYNGTITTEMTQNVAAAMIAGEVKIFRFKKTNLNISATLFPSLSDAGRLFFKMNDSYYIKLFSNLTWNISFYGDWDTRPPAGLVGSDFGTSTGLGWTFGNR